MSPLIYCKIVFENCQVGRGPLLQLLRLAAGIERDYCDYLEKQVISGHCLHHTSQAWAQDNLGQRLIIFLRVVRPYYDNSHFIC